jgi:hypothetical protein
MSTRLDMGLRALIIANIIVVGVLAGAMIADWLEILPPRVAAENAPASPEATIELMEMGLAHIPTSNSCLLCHDGGGDGEVKPIPALGHPIAGWTACVTCHTDDDLGRTAPGHDGIAQTECLSCHKEAPEGPAITQAHANLDEHCLDCHGSVAHLPTSMVGRDQDECWLCHKPAPEKPPQAEHPDDARLACRACHQSAETGALPIDHALRKDSTCVLCHEMDRKLSSPTASPAASGPAP